ncbi:P-loop containing nucleoside triphosphate hydrolase protein [Xylariaceae sp. FL0804]|nr:P-loop containing nucleoside triphosphate hydrolase protein [Xylariaceae sp. FL0804]
MGDKETYRYNFRTEIGSNTLGTMDYVLATYYDVRRSWPSEEVQAKLDLLDSESSVYKKLRSKNIGALFKVKWKRVVLDEAQRIKNKFGTMGKQLRKPGDDAHGRQPKGRSRFLEACDATPGKVVPPSAKMTAIKDSVLEWQHTAPDDKIIIFVQFSVSARIIGRMLEGEGISFLYFWGDMNGEARDKAIRDFHEKGDIKVLVAGLKCGSTGLNITCANRVISVDPWWNHSIEEQAFARVFRHGQTKSTYFRRLVVRGSIDERILDIQKKKMEEIEEAMVGEKKSRELSIREKATLFGEVVERPEGGFRIETED